MTFPPLSGWLVVVGVVACASPPAAAPESTPAAPQVERHEGYIVLPACLHKTAVVSLAGDRAPWEHEPGADAQVPGHYYRPNFSIRSIHATGFGPGCARPWAYQLIMSDPAELRAATEAVGAWLVAVHILGEIDLVIQGMPERHREVDREPDNEDFPGDLRLEATRGR